MLARQYDFYTTQEYLAIEEEAKRKSEYYDGEIVALAGASLNHNRIAGNIHTALNNSVGGKPCESFIGDVKVWIEERNFFTYPDVMVVCGETKFVESRSDTITNPKIIIEVLSESTERYDRSAKFHAYWTLDTLEEYILVDQYRLRVEYFRRTSAKEWALRVLTNIEDVLDLTSVGVEITLSSIYRNVDWEEDEK
ncbi:MAG TPA: Uma2 family endonuclease [Chloroflexi bacterium]|nr:Uma2 family endonuclease [Chloroflexota bacterium]